MERCPVVRIVASRPFWRAPKSGLNHPANDLPKLCTDLKSTLGVGGSVQARIIELQGDQKQKIVEFFARRNLKT